MTSPAKMTAAIYATIDLPVLAEGTQVIRSQGWHQTLNPLLKDSSENRVGLSHLQDSEVELRIEETFAMYRAEELPFK